jgi:hypothetical protein
MKKKQKKQKKTHHGLDVGTVPKSNRKTHARDQIDTPIPHTFCT